MHLDSFLYLLLEILCLVSVVLFSFFADAKECKIHRPLVPRQFVIAHRGLSGRFPEQTLAAYEAALVDEAAQYLECDLQLTLDGKLICLHDPNMLETTDVESHEEFRHRRTTYTIDGEVHEGYFTKDFMYGEIMRLRTVQRRTSRNQLLNGLFPLISLEDLLDVASNTVQNSCQDPRKNNVLGTAMPICPIPKAGVYLETKHPSWYLSLGFNITGILLELLENKGYIRTRNNNYVDSSSSDAFYSPTPIFIQSFEAWNLMEIRKIAGDQVFLTSLVLGRQHFGSGYGAVYDRKENNNSSSTPYELQLVEAKLDWIRTFADAVGPEKNLLLPPQLFYEPVVQINYVEEAHSLGLQVHPYTFMDESDFVMAEFHNQPFQELAYFFDVLGVDAVFTDYADTAAHYLRSHEPIHLLDICSFSF